jgi:hypothetical protein
MLQVSGSRASLGPNELAAYEAALQCVMSIGLSGREMVSIVDLVAGYVRGAAQLANDAALAEQRTGISDDEWWSARAPMLDQVMVPSRFPASAFAQADGAFDQPGSELPYTLQEALQDFEFGLQRVLDGIEAFVTARRSALEEG